MLRIGELKQRKLMIRSRVIVWDERTWLISLKSTLSFLFMKLYLKNVHIKHAPWKRRGLSVLFTVDSRSLGRTL